MKRLSPGVYDDGEGGLHLELGELLVAEGWPNTAENRARLATTWAEWAADTDTPLTFNDTPIIPTEDE